MVCLEGRHAHALSDEVGFWRLKDPFSKFYSFIRELVGLSPLSRIWSEISSKAHVWCMALQREVWGKASEVSRRKIGCEADVVPIFELAIDAPVLHDDFHLLVVQVGVAYELLEGGRVHVEFSEIGRAHV